MNELQIAFKNLRSAALTIAKTEIKTAIKHKGGKVSYFTTKDISEAARQHLCNNFPRLIERALKHKYW